jgi:hypothetical protein
LLRLCDFELCLYDLELHQVVEETIVNFNINQCLRVLGSGEGRKDYRNKGCTLKKGVVRC